MSNRFHPVYIIYHNPSIIAKVSALVLLSLKSDSLIMKLIKVDGSNKHAAESSKTPVQKKAKFVTPEKTGEFAVFLC